MLTVLSPAKSLDFETRPATRKFSEAALEADTDELIDVMRSKSPAELEKLMGISPALAELNHERFNDFERPFTMQTARAAILAFDGDVYRGMDAPGSFGPRDFTQAQKVVRILSGLYGVLRPLDLIQPYRLEMGTRLATDRGSDLYQFWGTKITNELNVAMATSPGAAALVNLASNEYFGAVSGDKINGTVVHPAFLDEKNGEYKIISFYAKVARGAMAAWIVQERIKTIRALPGFDRLGYRFDPERSTRVRPVFVRPADAVV